MNTTHRKWIGSRVLTLKRVTSTNDVAREMNEPGLAIVAEEQSVGRGQYGRSWQSPPGQSLLLSVTVAPTGGLFRPSTLTAWAAVAVANAVAELTGLQARIKWPNDLLVEGKKVCGILCECQGNAIVGIGLNLNQSAVDFADLPDAASLSTLGCHVMAPVEALNAVLDHLDHDYDQLITYGRSALEAAWVESLDLLDKPVAMELLDGTMITGKLRQMNLDGLTVCPATGPPVHLVPEQVRRLNPAPACTAGAGA